MPTGKVKWFNNAKGYGFILPDVGGEDLFAHYSSVQMDGYKTLKAGQVVSYDTVPSDKGLHAVNIKTVESSPPAVSPPVKIKRPDTEASNINIEETALEPH